MLIKVTVEGVYYTTPPIRLPQFDTVYFSIPTVILSEVNGKRQLKITSSIDRGLDISQELYLAEGSTLPQEYRASAFVHLYNLLTKNESIIKELTITDYNKNLDFFYAHLQLQYKGREEGKVAIAPTDGIVLALMAGCDIFVEENLLEKPEKELSPQERYSQMQAEAALKQFETMDDDEEPKA